jgi:hypothetical protein
MRNVYNYAHPTLHRFKEEGIDFASPTQTRCLGGDPMRKLTVGIESADGPTAVGPKLGESFNLGGT